MVHPCPGSDKSIKLELFLSLKVLARSLTSDSFIE